MRRVLAAGLAVALLASPAWAARWRVDPARSELTFSALDSLQAFTGVFKTWTAQIDFDPDHLETSSVDVVIDMTSADARDEMRNGHIPGPDWFDVAHFPKARFVSSRIAPRAGGSYEAVGTLTIKTVRKPLTLPFTVEIKDGQAHAKGGATVLRKDFRLGSTVADDRASLKVKIAFDLFAKAAD